MTGDIENQTAQAITDEIVERLLDKPTCVALTNAQIDAIINNIISD